MIFSIRYLLNFWDTCNNCTNIASTNLDLMLDAMVLPRFWKMLWKPNIEPRVLKIGPMKSKILRVLCMLDTKTLTWKFPIQHQNKQRIYKDIRHILISFSWNTIVIPIKFQNTLSFLSHKNYGKTKSIFGTAFIFINQQWTRGLLNW